MTAKRQRLSGQDIEGEQRVRSVDAAGRGIVRVGEHQILVPGTYRGETIRLQLIHRGKHGVHHATMTELLEPARSRVESPCPHFLDCGGCDLLHIEPEEQLRWKREVLAEELHLDRERIDPVRHAEFHYDYRAQAKFVVGEKGVLGSYKRHSHSVAQMDECVVHAPAIAAAHQLVQTKLQQEAPPGIRYVVMRASIADERVIITLVCKTPRAGVYRQFAHELGTATFVAAVDFHHNEIEGNAIFGPAPVSSLYDDGKALSESIGELSLQLKSNAFSQINPTVAGLLYEHVCAEIAGHPTEDGAVLDLYAGSGGIGLSYLLKDSKAKLTGVESTAAANEAARATADAHDIGGRHRAVDSPVLSYLQDQKSVPMRVVVNPPRKGLGGAVVRELLRLAPICIVYVSCNPKTLAKDTAALTQGGYEIVRVAPFDMFPNTAQIETAVTLRRVGI